MLARPGEDGRIQTNATVMAAAVSAAAASGPQEQSARGPRQPRRHPRPECRVRIDVHQVAHGAVDGGVDLSSVICVSQRRHLFFQDPARFRDSPFHGADGNAEDEADLRVAVVAGAGEQERVAQLARQRRMSRLSVRCSCAGSEALFLRSCGAACVRSSVAVVSGRSCGPSVAATGRRSPAVERLAPRDRQQPGPKGRIAAEAGASGRR